MKPLWNDAEAAVFLGISKFSVRGKVHRRELPFIKIGRRTLFSQESLEEFVKQNSHEAVRRAK